MFKNVNPFLLTQLNALIFMQVARVRISYKLLWYLTIGIQYVNDECWNITGMHLKCVYLVKLLINCQASFSPEILENTSNFKGWGLTLLAYIKKRNMFYKKLLCTTLLCSCDKNPWKISAKAFLFTQFAGLQLANL